MKITLNASRSEIVEALFETSTKEGLRIIMDYDRMVASVEFTEQLVLALVKTLIVDKESVKLPFIDWSKVK